MEILIYAIPAGQTERYMEDLISSQCKTESDIKKVKQAASADGWHSFRIANFNGEKPDFTKVF